MRRVAIHAGIDVRYILSQPIQTCEKMVSLWEGRNYAESDSIGTVTHTGKQAAIYFKTGGDASFTILHTSWSSASAAAVCAYP